MADWQAFATAFMKDTAGYINERKDKAEAYEEKQRDLAEKNLPIMQKRQKVAGTVKGIAQRLINQGVPEAVVRTAAASGPTGLMDLDKTWSQARVKYGADFATENPDLVQDMVSTDVNLAQLGMTGDNQTSLDEFIGSQYGLTKTTTGDYKAEETGVFKRMLGYNATDRARQKLDEEMAGMGMSVYDINNAASMADFDSLVPGASVQYGKMPSKFTSDDITDEMLQFNRIETNLKTKPEYIAAQSKLEQLVKDQTAEIGINPKGSDKYDEITNEINEQQTLLNKLKRDAYGPLVNARIESMYGSSYLDIMGPLLANRLGTDYVSSLRESSAEAVASAPEPVTSVGETSEPVTPEGETVVDSSGNTVEVQTHSEILKNTPYIVEQTEAGPVIVIQGDLRDLKTGKVLHRRGTRLSVAATEQLLKDAADFDAKQSTQKASLTAQEATRSATEEFEVPTPEAFEAMQEQLGGPMPLTEEQYNSLTKKQKEALGLRTSVIGSSIDKEFGGGLANSNFTKSVAIQESADPDTMYRVYIPQFAGKTRVFAVKGSDLKYFSKARLADNQKAAVIIEGVAQGDERKMSTKRLEKKFGRPFEEVTETEKPSVLSAEGATETEKPRVIPADEDQEKVLKEHGQTLMRYLQGRGLTRSSSDREVEKALSEWSFENQVEMPLNRNAIIYALKQFIGDGE